MLLVAHGVLGCWLIHRSFPLPPRAEGALVGSTGVMAALSLQSVVRWGEQALLMSQLAHHGLFREGRGTKITPAHPEPLRVSSVVVTEEPTFTRMVCLALWRL